MLALTSILLSRLATATTDRPVIGIMSHPYPGGQFLPASYVKWIESAGGRVVPVSYNASVKELDTLLAQLNGFLWMGGDAAFNSQAQYIYSQVVQMNLAGDFFPLWGTCLGFEWILESNGAKLDGGYDAHNISIPLTLTPLADESRLYATTPGMGEKHELRRILATEPTTLNSHSYGITPEHFIGNAKLNNNFNILSTNVDRKNVPFVSTIEAKTLPIYGTQWHPEKNNFEFGMRADGEPYEAIDHSSIGVRVSLELAYFFVNEARKSDHYFKKASDLDARLIYRYAPMTETGPKFVQSYFLKY